MKDKINHSNSNFSINALTMTKSNNFDLCMSHLARVGVRKKAFAQSSINTFNNAPDHQLSVLMICQDSRYGSRRNAVKKFSFGNKPINRRIRIALSIILNIFILLITWIIFAVFLILVVSSSDYDLNQLMFAISCILMKTSVVLNPLVYTLSNKKFTFIMKSELKKKFSAVDSI